MGYKWEHKQRFTLINDAASLMTPFAGEGVNKSIKNALMLVEQIKISQDGSDNAPTLDQAVLRYKQKMFSHTTKYIFTRKNSSNAHH